jgi:hypothetical protein
MFPQASFHRFTTSQLPPASPLYQLQESPALYEFNQALAVSLSPHYNLLQNKSDHEALLTTDQPADSIVHDELPRIEALEIFYWPN